MKLTEDKFKVGERVYCVLNHSIRGTISAVSSDIKGQWNFYLEVDDKKGFKKWIGTTSRHAVFLHWQLRRICKVN